MLSITYRNLKNGSCEAVLQPSGYDFEIGQSLSPSLVLPVKYVRLILVGGVMLSMPVSLFASALEKEDMEGFASAIFDTSDRMSMRDFIKRSDRPLSAVTPPYYTVTYEGLKCSEISRAFSEEMQQSGTAVLPLVSINTSFSSVKADEIASELRAQAKMYSLDGFVFDAPMWTGDQLVSFLTSVEDELQNLSVSVRVYPLDREYDYKALNRLCDDLYVECTPFKNSYGVPKYSVKRGEKAALAAINGGFDRGRIILSLDMGGSVTGPGWDGSIIATPKEVETVAENFAVKESFDRAEGAEYLSFTVKAGQTFHIGGKRLYPGDYKMNIGSSVYCREMLMLKDRLGLKGAALLRMPFSQKDLFDFFYDWLSGGYFSDISGTFGRDEIMKAYVGGIMEGTGGHLFSPYSDLTRAEAAAITVRFLNLPLDGKSPPFDDVKGHWAEKYIAAAFKSGHMVGVEGGSFMPDEVLTREQAATLICRIAGVPYKSPKNGIFSDVEPDSWSSDAIYALHAAGIIKGYEDGTYRPKEAVTREEMAILAGRLDRLMQG